MRQVSLIRPGDPPTLVVESVQGAGLPMVYAEVEPLDVQVAMGHVPRPLPTLPGATAIVQTADGLGYVMPGGCDGTWADKIDVDSRWVVPLPPGIDPATVACTTGAGVVARLALFDRGGLAKGETVLVIGASGFVGRAAVELATHAGARVIATARNPAAIPEGPEGALSLDGFADKVRSLTDGHGADLIVDVLGGDSLNEAIRAGAIGCRHLLVGTASGTRPGVSLPLLLIRQHRLEGFRRSATNADVLREAHQDTLSDIEAGVITARQAPVFDLELAAAAIQTVREGGHALLSGRHHEGSEG